MKKMVAAALVLALVGLLGASVALGQGNQPRSPDEIETKTLDDLETVVKNIVGKLMGFAGLVLFALAAWQGVKIAKSGIEPRERAEALAGLAYLIIGAMVCFGVYFWLGLAKGLIQVK